ncbi:MAG: hypothetical protein FWF50_02815 [Defluviitaleaceae bacterium]|nr:hypothetical protein [Defluviitaleaceae bacterium]
MANINLTRPSPLDERSPESFILGVGAFFVNPDTSQITGSTTSQEMSDILDRWQAEGYNLGATSGGGNFTGGTTIEPIETDDLFANAKGFLVVTEVHGGFTATLQDISVRNLGLISPTMIRLEDGSYSASTIIPNDAYKRVVHVSLTGGAHYRVIELANAINIAPFEIDFQDSQTAPGSVALEIVGVSGSLSERSRAPYKMWFISPAGTTTQNAPIIFNEESN